MAGFTTKWTVAGDVTARTITLPFTDNGTYNAVVDWGDLGPTSTITTYNDVDRVHTYASDGTYDVIITGDAPGWSFNDGGDKLKIVQVVDFGAAIDFSGFAYLTGGFYGCTNLTALGINPILDDSLPDLQNTFYNCTSLTAIPTGLFDNCTAVSTSGFYGTFLGCSSLTAIPANLFDYNTAVSTSGFNRTFRGCSNLTAIPSGLFDNNTAVSTNGFYQTFYGCTSLTTLPADLFRYNTLVSSGGFYGTFHGCTSLTTIPSGLFDNNTSVSAYGFTYTFYNCPGITAIPANLFRYNTLVSSYGFYMTFNGCTSLTTIPTDLFRYNTSVVTLGFIRTFYNCTKLVLNRNIFYADGEQSTRFLNQSVDFTECFYRTSYTGTEEGEAPDLWNCTFGTGTPVTTDCFNGAFAGVINAYIAEDSELQGSIENTSGDAGGATISGTLTDDTKHVARITYATDSLITYRDGVAGTVDTTVDPPTALDELDIGQDGSSNAQTNGLIQNFRIFKKPVKSG